MVQVGKAFGVTFKVLFNSCLAFLFLAFAPLLLDIEPNSFNITLPETFDGPLRANNKLSQADHLFVNEIIGPESLAVWKGDVYTGVSDGRIVRIRNDRYRTVAQFGDPKKCGDPWEIEKCGRPLGMRFDSKGLLYVADAYYGLHTVNVTTGKITRILTSKKEIGNVRPRFLDDLVISEGKTGNVIYFTDASNKWDLKNVFYTVGEHDESGRVIKYDLRTKNATVLMKSLGFPNGIELTDDKTAILVCEFNNRRIMRHYVRGQRRGQTDVFSFNLPGEPDNIRRSADPHRETYWVALAMGRNVKNPSFAIDHLSGWPKTRKALMRLLHLVGTGLEYAGKILNFRLLTELGFKTKTGAIIFHTITHYGLAVELDADGKIIQSLHSPDGRTTLLSEVREVVVGNKKVLYLGSYGNNYIGKITLGTLQQLQRPLLTHEKKQYIEQKPIRSSRYRPQLPFDMKNPHFGPPSVEPDDFDFSGLKSAKKTKTSKKTKSSKTSKKSAAKTSKPTKTSKSPKAESPKPKETSKPTNTQTSDPTETAKPPN